MVIIEGAIREWVLWGENSKKSKNGIIMGQSKTI